MIKQSRVTQTAYNILVFDELANVLGMVRILVAPPGTPDATAKVLREALQKTLTNPELIQKATVQSLAVEYGTADQVKATVSARLGVANKYKDIVMPVYK